MQNNCFEKYFSCVYIDNSNRKGEYLRWQGRVVSDNIFMNIVSQENFSLNLSHNKFKFSSNGTSNHCVLVLNFEINISFLKLNFL